MTQETVITRRPGTPSAQPTRRGAELALLTLAWLVGNAAVVLVRYGTGEDLGVFIPVVGLSAALGLLAHLMVRWRAPYAEPVLLPTALLLNMLGLAMIYRLDIAEAQRARANDSPPPTPESFGQLAMFILAIGLLSATLLLLRDHRRLQRYTYISLFLGLVMLLLPLVPGLGATVNGATLWIRIGPFSFQPGELAKILLAIFLAGFLVTARDSLSIVRRRFLGVAIPRGRDMGPLLIAWLVALGVLVFERDLGTSAVFFGMFVCVLYVATGRRSWLVIAAVLVAVGGFLAYLLFNHVRVRVQIWWDPWAYANDEGYQIVQSLFGLANGGVLGTGWGLGYPQLVPFANSDFIIASLGEELGLTGLFAILLLYAILVQRGLRTAVACRDTFGRLLAVGLSSVFALQVFVVVGGVTKLIPMTGLTTPFLSAGGSSLIASWIMIAILLRISDLTRQPEKVLPPLSDDTIAMVLR